jgi:lipopolysaccharide export system protein LptA
MRKRRLFFFIFLLLSGFEVYAQREEDKVHLLSAELAEFYEYFGVKYRRVIGPARFLHNNTFILCDTALWNTTTNEIDAIGHVEVIQKGTRLTGETIHYIGDINVAEVRGRVVELIDKDQNRLRTQHLNFNTKDSIGYFFNGGSMVDNEGTILESRRGYYYSKEKLFSFYEHVEMGTDTVRIKADSLYYHSDINLAEFWGNVQGWHTDGFLTAEEGTYDRENEIFNFIRNVYIQTDEQEVWADDVTYDRNKNTARLIKNIQIKTPRNRPSYWETDSITGKNRPGPR